MAQLISVVSGYPELYNATLESYRNSDHKMKAWTAVSLQLKLPVNECRKKWKNMRDTYARQKRMELQKQAAGEPFQPNWKYYRHMNFIAPFLKERATSPCVQGSSGSKSKASAGDHSEEEGIEEGKEDHLQVEIGENGNVVVVEKEEQEVGERNGDIGSVEASKPAFIIHEIGEEDLAHPLYSPSPSLSSLPPPPPHTTVMPRRPRRKRKRQRDRNDSSDSEVGNCVEDDTADEMFFFSLLPYLKRLSFQKKSALKLQIHQLIYDAAFK